MNTSEKSINGHELLEIQDEAAGLREAAKSEQLGSEYSGMIGWNEQARQDQGRQVVCRGDQV